MSALTIETVFESVAGKVTRIEWEGSEYPVRFKASHKCHGYDAPRGRHYEYGVSITPPDQHPAAAPGFLTLEEAVEAITKYPPHWPSHQRDHAHCLRRGGVLLPDN